MQKKHLLPLLITLITLSIFHYPFSMILAVSPSPSASPSNLDQITENLKKRLQDSLVEESPSHLANKRAYIGVVKDLIKDTLIIEDKDGKKDITLEDETVILRAPGNTPIKPANIRIDDSIIAIGIPAGVDTLTALRLIVSVSPLPIPSKTSGQGTLTKIGNTSLTLKVGENDQILSLTSKTILKTPVSTLELADLAQGDTLVYTATLDDKDVATATIIMRIGSTSL